MKTLLIIPAYNEEASLALVVNNLRTNYPQYDFVVVNDGSADDTLSVCQQEGFPVLDLPINLGLNGAFQAGAKYAYSNGYDCAVQFDADGQHLPEYIEPLVQALEDGADIAIASRFVKTKKPKSLRMFGSYLIALMIFLTTGKKLTDPTSGMRAFNRKMLYYFCKEPNFGPEPDTVSYLIKSGAVVREVQAEMQDRFAGSSYLNFLNSTKYMLRTGCAILVFQWMRKSKEVRRK